MNNLYRIGEQGLSLILFLEQDPRSLLFSLRGFRIFYDFLKKLRRKTKFRTRDVTFDSRFDRFRGEGKRSWAERKMICRKRKLPVSNHRFLLFREGNDTNGAYPAK